MDVLVADEAPMSVDTEIVETDDDKVEVVVASKKEVTELDTDRMFRAVDDEAVNKLSVFIAPLVKRRQLHTERI